MEVFTKLKKNPSSSCDFTAC